ncbi:hypothetical protein BEP19_09150 [Ammoniphilus oxalaticus]|uniref:Uncharacterized protein n=1 Tax=Ammoniphilus oxalaticus TaxID=66863 RepID=A0A419SKR1_9BACL|nr:hypothetical protein [Ammoniphilus oxalaticus]RKD24539.1 hypothetical protein BEP19_09150 [Ammoniphilus oxalaticus]
MLKKFSFWLSILSIGICLFHAFGFDEGNLVLIGLNPGYFIIPIKFDRIESYYIHHLLSFFIIGITVDKVKAVFYPKS